MTIPATTASSGNCDCIFPQTFSTGADETGTIYKVHITEFLHGEDGPTHSRQHACGFNPNHWRKVGETLRPLTPPKEKLLWVVRQRQEGKSPHWSLFAALDDNSDAPRGRVWQVNGDSEIGMRYAHRGPDDAFALFLTASFVDKLLVCDHLSEQWEAKVDEIANTIKPPGPRQPATGGRTRRRGLQLGDCKTWVWEVLDELVKEGIVLGELAKRARELRDLDPL
jgi:hypothetical protein